MPGLLLWFQSSMAATCLQTSIALCKYEVCIHNRMTDEKLATEATKNIQISTTLINNATFITMPCCRCVDLEQRVEELHAQQSTAQNTRVSAQQKQQHAAELEQMQQQLDRLRQDSETYRFSAQKWSSVLCAL